MGDRAMNDDDYDAAADFDRSIHECYRAVRARMAQGGPPWVPAPPTMRWAQIPERPEKDRAE